MSTANKFNSGSSAKFFCLAGHARVTLVSEKTGTRFTYKIKQAKDGNVFFVAILNGSDNTSDYAFIGTIFNASTFCHSWKSQCGQDAPSVKAFQWAWNYLSRGELPPGCEVWHEGCCGRCGRVLTVPESIESGIGPVCAGK